MDVVVVKGFFDDECRRFRVDRGRTFRQFVKAAAEAFSVVWPGGPRVHYVDEDGDKVTISSTYELRDAFSWHLMWCNPNPERNKAIKIFFRPSVPDIAAELSATTAQQQQQQEEEEEAEVLDIQQEAQEEQQPDAEREAQTSPRRAGAWQCLAVHRAVTCDKCEMYPLRGIRFKCLQCPDFDLCGGCAREIDASGETLGCHHPHHAMLKLPNPDMTFHATWEMTNQGSPEQRPARQAVCPVVGRPTDSVPTATEPPRSAPFRRTHGALCDMTDKRLSLGEDWYHKHGSGVDLCKRAFETLPAKEQHQFVQVLTADALGPDEPRYALFARPTPDDTAQQQQPAPAAEARVPASRVLAVGVGSSATSAQPAGSLDIAAVEKAAEEAVQKAVEAVEAIRIPPADAIASLLPGFPPGSSPPPPSSSFASTATAAAAAAAAAQQAEAIVPLVTKAVTEALSQLDLSGLSLFQTPPAGAAEEEAAPAPPAAPAPAKDAATETDRGGAPVPAGTQTGDVETIEGLWDSDMAPYRTDADTQTPAVASVNADTQTPPAAAVTHTAAQTTATPSPSTTTDGGGEEEPRRSIHANVSTHVSFANNSASTMNVIWLDYTGNEVHYRTLQPGQSYRQQTYETHPWVVRDSTVERAILARFTPAASTRNTSIDTNQILITHTHEDAPAQDVMPGTTALPAAEQGPVVGKPVVATVVTAVHPSPGAASSSDPPSTQTTVAAMSEGGAMGDAVTNAVTEGVTATLIESVGDSLSGPSLTDSRSEISSCTETQSAAPTSSDLPQSTSSLLSAPSAASSSGPADEQSGVATADDGDWSWIKAEEGQASAAENGVDDDDASVWKSAHTTPTRDLDNLDTWEELHGMLEEMGFSDVAVNRKLLVEHQGNLEEVVEILTADM